jgi:(1->4)-alpha-D-glucan 1-alpha-D-glucosylmutase
VDRLVAYMLKAIREAKIHTSWINDNEPYETAVRRFVRRSLDGPTTAAFLEVFLPLVSEIATAGAVNALSQLVLKIASPGVPDFYQGTELWDLHLVDPDNRHPVDFDARHAILGALDSLIEACAGRVSPGHPDQSEAIASGVHRLADEWPDGRIKVFITAAGLRLRRERPAVFLRGRYLSLEVEIDSRADAADIVGFVREHDEQGVMVVVPRFVAGLLPGDGAFPLGQAWSSARVLLRPEWPHHQIRNVLTGEIVRPELIDGRWSLLVRDLMAHCPVALLVFG